MQPPHRSMTHKSEKRCLNMGDLGDRVSTLAKFHHCQTSLPSIGKMYGIVERRLLPSPNVVSCNVSESAPKLNVLFYGQCYTLPPNCMEISLVGKQTTPTA